MNVEKYYIDILYIFIYRTYIKPGEIEWLNIGVCVTLIWLCWFLLRLCPLFENNYVYCCKFSQKVYLAFQFLPIFFVDVWIHGCWPFVSIFINLFIFLSLLFTFIPYCLFFSFAERKSEGILLCVKITTSWCTNLFSFFSHKISFPVIHRRF